MMYDNQPLKIVESFNYLGLEVPSNQRWNECVTWCLEAGKRTYYAFENTYTHGELSVGSQEIPFQHLSDIDASLCGRSMGR